jgi:solute carrier family 32 (vesicular inhibitory amino acid transporter)
MGILSTITLILVILFDGVTKLHAPGSLWEPAHTEAVPFDIITSLPVSFGLFMAGFAGHAVIPSLVRDMAEPKQDKSMINWAFVRMSKPTLEQIC